MKILLALFRIVPVVDGTVMWGKTLVEFSRDSPSLGEVYEFTEELRKLYNDSEYRVHVELM